MRRALSLVAAALAVGLVSSATADGPLTVEKNDWGVSVRIDGELFTEYIACFGDQPVLWPILGPTGEPMTRAYPMGEAGASERPDHPWHQSFWFAHGDVDGRDFWSPRHRLVPKQDNYLKRKTHADGNRHWPSIRHRDFVTVAALRDRATIVTRNDWLDAAGQRLCEDERHLTFGVGSSGRWIDFAIMLKAPDRDVTFGDTKEGTFAVRVAGTMKVDAGLGGRIVNSRGQTDKEAWGQAAEWVDYHGPVADETVGVAILCHPTSFRHPGRWHVRSYGLFAANPFGSRDFGGPPSDGVTLRRGESLALRYRVVLHVGDHRDADIAAAYAAYADGQ